MHDKVTRTLYKSLLRTVKPFTSKETGPILTSLLHRSGSDDHIDYIEEAKATARASDSSSFPSIDTSAPGGNTSGHLSREQARNLSHSYAELKKKREASHQDLHHHEESQWLTIQHSDHGEIDDLPSDIKLSAHPYISQIHVPPHIMLYKSCVREIISSHMNFPTKTKTLHESNQTTVMDRLKGVIQREFRGGDDSWSKRLPCVNDKHRREAAFLAFKELQKKLTWAESKLNYDTTAVETRTGNDDDADDGKCRDNLMAKDIERLPQKPASSYLQTGTYLVAHPLLTGCFAKTVICLLEHTPSDSDGEHEDDVSESLGGTYGIIVNKPLNKTIHQSEHATSKDRTLGEVIRHDCLPEGVTLAFGDCPVRNGGPVHLSVQMLRTTTSDEDEKLKLGGSVLSMVVNDHDCSVDSGRASDCVETSTLSEKGSTRTSTSAAIKNEVKSTAMHTDSAIYFAGDIIKASQAVIDKDMEKDSFSFVIGASCWEDGQLESEIEKGYWIPFSGPPQIAFSGACDISGVDGISVTESSLWVSIMTALGEEEGRFAQMMETIEYDNNGLPCDEV
jgi:putative AlgH/UPF0301 family transcriptional regulator